MNDARDGCWNVIRARVRRRRDGRARARLEPHTSARMTSTSIALFTPSREFFALNERHARARRSSGRNDVVRWIRADSRSSRVRARAASRDDAADATTTFNATRNQVAGNPYEQNSLAANERKEMFNDIAPVYDALNDALSLGLHRAWKRCCVKWSGARVGDRALDACCGSGDVALKLADVVGVTGAVVGLDFASKQLAYAGEKERKKREEAPERAQSRMSAIEWVEGDALRLPFDDDSFDCATMAYGLRNVSDIPLALSELRRVLRPGAKLAVLDFNNPTDGTTAAVQAFVLDNIVVPIADLNGVAAEYRYLRPSIERFPRGAEQVDLAREAGFREATHYALSPGGLMGCLVAMK